MIFHPEAIREAFWATLVCAFVLLVSVELVPGGDAPVVTFGEAVDLVDSDSDDPAVPCSCMECAWLKPMVATGAAPASELVTGVVSSPHAARASAPALRAKVVWIN